MVNKLNIGNTVEFVLYINMQYATAVLCLKTLKKVPEFDLGKAVGLESTEGLKYKVLLDFMPLYLSQISKQFMSTCV